MTSGADGESQWVVGADDSAISAVIAANRTGGLAAAAAGLAVAGWIRPRHRVGRAEPNGRYRMDGYRRRWCLSIHARAPRSRRMRARVTAT